MHERRRMWKEGFEGMLVLQHHDRTKNTPTRALSYCLEKICVRNNSSWTFRVVLTVRISPVTSHMKRVRTPQGPEGRSSKHECVVNLPTSCRTFVNSVFILVDLRLIFSCKASLSGSYVLLFLLLCDSSKK